MPAGKALALAVARFEEEPMDDYNPLRDRIVAGKVVLAPEAPCR